LISLQEEQEGLHQWWIRQYADNNFNVNNADWADAWFALDGLMHRTCHAAMTIVDLRSRPGLTSYAEMRQLLDSLNAAHAQWRNRKVVRNSDDVERLQELMNEANIDRDGASEQLQSSGNTVNGAFLGYTPMRILDPFFASRLNNWRAIRLHVSLIEEPMWGRYDGPQFVCALDLCRTYAALGEERRYLGAEKAVGLYLAGVAFGGPKMYAVCLPIQLMI